jgi:hypothetical protein
MPAIADPGEDARVGQTAHLTLIQADELAESV